MPATEPHNLRASLTPNGVLIDEKDLDNTLDFPTLFGATAPVELEIGCGNGRYLQRAAVERCDHLFLGVERAVKYARLAGERVVKRSLGNVRICRADATRLLSGHIASKSIHTLHVYHTDPWPKTRHAKRRLFQTPFLETIHRILRPGGSVFIQVDLFWYFEEIMARFEHSPHFDVVMNGVDENAERTIEETTGFEQKALKKRGAVYFLEAVNRDDC